MKADIPKEERQRLEREQWAEIRAMLAPRHFTTMSEQMAVDAAMARLEREHLMQAAPVINATPASMGQPAPVPATVVMPEPEPAALPEPIAIRHAAPDLPFDLRFHLGLR